MYYEHNKYALSQTFKLLTLVKKKDNCYEQLLKRNILETNSVAINDILNIIMKNYMLSFSYGCLEVQCGYWQAKANNVLYNTC